MNNELLIVISGPSGAGKGTVVNRLIENGGCCLSISATTRKPRDNEKEGISYFFKTKEEFKALIDDNRLLEYAEYCGNFYGTPSDYVYEAMSKGNNVILEIEAQGALQVKKNMPEAALIFLIPPTLAALKDRLTGRGTETADAINERLEKALEEIELINKYDYIVVNDSIDEAVNDINAIIKAESLKTNKNNDLINIFKGAK